MQSPQIITQSLLSLLASPFLKHFPQLRSSLRPLLTLQHKLDVISRMHHELVQGQAQRGFPSGACLPLAELSPKKARAYQATGARPAAPLVDLKLDVQLSRNLTARDLAAPGRRYGRVSPEIVVLLEQLLWHVPGHQIVVESAYHPHVANRRGGGPKYSPHVDGMAVDIRCDDVSLEHLYELASRLVGRRGAVYLYKGQHVHLDLGGFYDRGIVG